MATKKRRKGLQPTQVIEQVTLPKLQIDAAIANEFDSYIETYGITSLDNGIEQAMAYAMKDDAEWQKLKKESVGAKETATKAQVAETA